MGSFASIRTYLTVLGIGTIVLAVLACLLPHDPYIRAQGFRGTLMQAQETHYERLHFDPTPIDIAFIGSSRTMAGIVPVELERHLASEGMPAHVANLSLPASGMDVILAQAREVLRTHPETKLIVLQVVERFPRDGHQAFGEIASVKDIVNSPWIINRNLPAHLLRLPMRQMRLFTETMLPEAFGYSRRPPAPGDAPRDSTGGWEPTRPAHPYDSPEHAAALRAEMMLRNAEMQPPVLPRSLAWAEFGVSRSSIESILDLAHANGTKVAFLFIPFYEGWDEPEEAGWLRQRAPLWLVTDIRSDARNYNDAAHPSPNAVPQISEAVATEIVGLMDNQVAGNDPMTGER